MHGHDQRASIQPGPAAALATSLLLPGTAVVDKVLGLPGVAAYLLLGAAGILIGWRRLVPAFLARVSPRLAAWLAGLTLAVVIAFVLLAYPLANSGRLGKGSDRDEALNLAARALLAGQYPYDQSTYLGNPISPLPGAIVLSIPFVLLGTSAYQNIRWLAAFFLVLRRRWREPHHALLLTWAVLLSPAVLHSLATGGDLLANALYVLVITAWLLHAAGSGARRWLPAAAALGLALSSRANFLLLGPLLFAYLGRTAGWRQAATTLAVTGATAALVTVPFILVDPAGFTPRATVDELATFNGVLPGADLLILAAAPASDSRNLASSSSSLAPSAGGRSAAMTRPTRTTSRRCARRETSNRSMPGYYDVPPNTLFEPTALVRDCVENGSDALLCDEAALPATFFDLSTGLAGELLHRLSIYRMRLAAVVPDPAAHSANFQAFVAEANKRDLARFFPTRQEAVRWLESDP